MNATPNSSKDDVGQEATAISTAVEPSVTEEPATSTQEESVHRPCLLLLVEDDWRTHTALRKLLTKKGWEVHSAMTVAGGLALLNLKPDAIILDLMLPDGDGAQVLRQARADGMESRIVITTGVNDPARLDEIRRLGPDTLLHKPLEFSDLLKAIDLGRKYS